MRLNRGMKRTFSSTHLALQGISVESALIYIDLIASIADDAPEKNQPLEKGLNYSQELRPGLLGEHLTVSSVVAPSLIGFPCSPAVCSCTRNLTDNASKERANCAYSFDYVKLRQDRRPLDNNDYGVGHTR